MKKLFNQKLILFASGLLMLTACGDDDEVKTTGQFVLGDETTRIAKGYFVYDTSPNSDAEDNEYYRNQLVFFGNGLKVEGSGENIDVVGEGNMLELYVNNEGQQLQPGLYIWQAEENEQPFDLWLGSLTQNVNTANEVSYQLVSGALTVSKSGSVYTITFTGAAYLEIQNPRQEAGIAPIQVTAQFKGKLSRVGYDF